MAGVSAPEAIDAYVGRLRRAVNCIDGLTRLLIASPTNLDQHHLRPGTVTFQGENDQVGASVPLLAGDGGKSGLKLYISQQYRVIHLPDDHELGPYKVRTASYEYVILDEMERELLIWQWHPEAKGRRLFPHLHISYVQGPSASIKLPTSSGELNGSYSDIDVTGLHVATGRVLLEDVVRFVIEDLGVAGADQYQAKLKDNVSAFHRSSTWTHSSQIEVEYEDVPWKPQNLGVEQPERRDQFR